MTLNNLLRVHDAFTLSYAGPFKPEELKYIYGQYSQVLNAEGLLFFVDASDGWGRPELDPSFQQVAPDYWTKSVVFETGLTFPWICTRERNLVDHRAVVRVQQRRLHAGGAGFRAELERPSLRGGRFKVNGDWADPFNGINQINNVITSKGFEGFSSTANGQPLASRPNGRVDFSKLEATFTRRAAIAGEFLLADRRSMDNWPARRSSTPNCAPLGAGVRPRFRSVRTGRGRVPREPRASCVTTYR